MKFWATLLLNEILFRFEIACEVTGLYQWAECLYMEFWSSEQVTQSFPAAVHTR